MQASLQVGLIAAVRARAGRPSTRAISGCFAAQGVSKKPIAEDLLARSQSPEKVEELAGLLATGTWTHDYPITFEEAQQLGLNVSSDMPPVVLQLSLFPQPVRRQPSVEFLPGPHRSESPKPPDVSR
jgi:hypothetical protein